ncbi:MAG: T9SS type A sorting domain-containing protein, partial [Saprospiraceae bacterium]|nr:T9SS type A sorting domain-containing protein [Saprospiraceae bacterium]
CAAVAEVVVEQMISSTEEADGLALMIYPNPAANWVKVVLSAGAWQLELSDASGRTLRSKGCGTGDCLLDMRGLPGGMYVLTARNGNMVYVGKVVKR